MDYFSLLSLYIANAPDSDRKDLLSELELMKKLKPHPHVIKLVACVTESGKRINIPLGVLLRRKKEINFFLYNVVGRRTNKCRKCL